MTEGEYKDKTENRFVLGYSFGALFANMITLKRDGYFNGMMFLSPPFNADFSKYKHWMKIAEFVAKYFPTLGLIKLKGIKLINHR